jgi:hypothetical protein
MNIVRVRSVFWLIFFVFYIVSIVSNDSINIDEIAQRVFDEAWEHMPSELQKCKSLKDIKALLKSEEQKCLLQIKNEFNIPDCFWRWFISDIKKKKRRFRRAYAKTRKSVVDHSLISVDKDLYESVIRILKLYKINPYFLDIRYDIQYHEEKTNATAYTWSYDYKGKQYAELSFIPCSKVYDAEWHKILTALHEGMHVWDIHCNQDQFLRFIIPEEEYNISISVKRWKRIHEKICEILPLIKFKNLYYVTLKFEQCINTGINKILDGQIIQWNHSPDDATHPERCDELLPWVLKIEEIIQNKK